MIGFIRVAALTPEVTLANPLANVTSILKLAEKARFDGATIVLAPELSLTGYIPFIISFHRRNDHICGLGSFSDTLSGKRSRQKDREGKNYIYKVSVHIEIYG